MSFRACARSLYREGGVPRFYTGFKWMILRAGPVSGLLLPLYDYTYVLLSSSGRGGGGIDGID